MSCAENVFSWRSKHLLEYQAVVVVRGNRAHLVELRRCPVLEQLRPPEVTAGTHYNRPIQYCAFFLSAPLYRNRLTARPLVLHWSLVSHDYYGYRPIQGCDVACSLPSVCFVVYARRDVVRIQN